MIKPDDYYPQIPSYLSSINQSHSSITRTHTYKHSNKERLRWTLVLCMVERISPELASVDLSCPFTACLNPLLMTEGIAGIRSLLDTSQKHLNIAADPEREHRQK